MVSGSWCWALRPLSKVKTRPRLLGVVGERGYAQLAGGAASLPPPGERSGPSRSASVPPPAGRRLGLGQPCPCGRGFSLERGIAAGRRSATRPRRRTAGRSRRPRGPARPRGRQLGLVDQLPIVARARSRYPPCGVSARRAAPARRPARPGPPVARRPWHRPARARSAPRGPLARPGGRRSARPSRRGARAPGPE